MSYHISKDGEAWREISDEEMHELLADLHADCWVDMSNPIGGFRMVTLAGLRNIRIEMQGPLPDLPGKRPASLYGIPIVYEDTQ